MCNISNTLQFSVLLWTLSSSLIPGHISPYFVLGVASVSCVIYTLPHNLPSARVDRLNNTIAVVEETLTQAKADCTRDYLALVAAETRFHSCGRFRRCQCRFKADWVPSQNQAYGVQTSHSYVTGTTVRWRNYLSNMTTISRCGISRLLFS
jgi:hypothetical protein